MSRRGRNGRHRQPFSRRVQSLRGGIVKRAWQRPILFVLAGALALGVPGGFVLGSFAADAMNPFYAMDIAPRQTVQQPELDEAAVDPLEPRPQAGSGDNGLDSPLSSDGAYPVAIADQGHPATPDDPINAR
jgi:hypothetical protein